MITFFRIATVLVVSLSPVAGIAQYRAEDEAKVMAFMARIGRDDAVIRSLEVKDEALKSKTTQSACTSGTAECYFIHSFRQHS